MTFWEIMFWGSMAWSALSVGVVLALWSRADRWSAAREKALKDRALTWETVAHQRWNSLHDALREVTQLRADLHSAKRLEHATDALTTLGRIFHDRARHAGFWGRYSSWEGHHDRQREWIGLQLALIGSELGEATEALRDGKIHMYVKDGKPEGLTVELMDAAIRILDLVTGLGGNPGAVAKAKHEYNLTRPRLHGRQA